MAYIRLDSSSLHMDVLVGINEKYKPTKEIKAVVKQADALKEQTMKFLTDNWNSSKTEEVAKIFESSPEEKLKFDEYIKNKYVPELSNIIKILENINKGLQEVAKI